MAHSLRNRNFLDLRDFTLGEIGFLLRLSSDLKAAKYAGIEQPGLKGKELALIFEQGCTRTRAGFEEAAHDLGARVTYLGPPVTKLGCKETVKDIARVMGRVFDGIEYRGSRQDFVEDLATHSGIPVWTGLTDAFHPTQILADFLTMGEHADKPLCKIIFAYLGDAASDVADSLLIGAAKMGMDVRLCGPRECWPEPRIEAEARSIAKTTGARIQITEDIAEATLGADFIYTDVLLSMNKANERRGDRNELLRPYQVTAGMIADTGNPRTRFMQCLPAFHKTMTPASVEIEQDYGLSELKVTNELFESAATIASDQAENRMHTIKAVLVATLGG